MGRVRRAWVSAGAVLILASAGCGSGPARAPVRLDAGPAVAAQVDPIHVSVSGLPAAGLVTVQARALDRDGQPWVSAAVFRATAAATLNLATTVPVSGSYQTADAAGLLWSLRPAAGTNQATGFSPPAAGFTVRLQALTGGRVGAEAVLLLASYFPHLAAAVIASSPTAAINGAVSAAPGSAWTVGGQPLAPVGNIPVTRIRVPLLMGDGGQDAAFFGLPPYVPYFTSAEVAALGGSAQADALATEQFWTRMITFLGQLAVHQTS